MSHFESSQIYTRDQYEFYKEDRCLPQNLYQGEDGLLMIATKQWFCDYEAVSYPIRFMREARYAKSHGLWVVRAALLDEDLKPAKQSFEIQLQPCGMLDPKGAYAKNNRHYAEGYVRGYSDEISDGFFRLLTAVDAHPASSNL